MKENVHISEASLRRLPNYLRTLKDKKENGITDVSSTLLANDLELNPIQVRKDLALISKSNGKPGVGFNIDELICDLEDFLNINNSTDAVIVGAGKLGSALMNYNGFGKSINVLMAFDNDKTKCDNKKIFYIDKMENLINRMNIHIGIIAVPKESAQEVCDELVHSGIKAIWNFAPTKLKVDKNVIVKNEDLSASLIVLLNLLKEKCERK